MFAFVRNGQIEGWGDLPFTARRLDTGAVIHDLPGTGSIWQPACGWFAVAVTPAPVANCHPSYIGVCLTQGIGDYDCAGGSGNGPNYIAGPFQVVGNDEFDLDRDGDGIGCE